MDWEQHKYGAGVECTFTPRENFKGRAMRPGMADHAGKTVRLIALWPMGDDDPYPGEWALGATDRRSEVFGRMWIASGDVTPNVQIEPPSRLLAKVGSNAGLGIEREE